MSRFSPLAFTLIVLRQCAQFPIPLSLMPGPCRLQTRTCMLMVDAGEQDPRDAGTTTDAGEVSEPLCRPDPERLNGVYRAVLMSTAPVVPIVPWDDAFTTASRVSKPVKMTSGARCSVAALRSRMRRPLRT